VTEESAKKEHIESSFGRRYFHSNDQKIPCACGR